MKKEICLKPVFLLSPGRSGSTLLQRYLNCSTDLILWGEHAGFLRGIANSYYTATKNAEVQKLLKDGQKYTQLLLDSKVPVSVDIEWTNNFNKEELRSAYTRLILELFSKDIPPSVRWGFKEIRYTGREILFLRETFAEAQFVYIVRNPLDTIASMIAAWTEDADHWQNKAWKNDIIKLEKANSQIEQICRRMIQVANGIKEHYLDNKNGYLVRFEDLKERPVNIVNEVCNYLNISFPSRDAIQMIADDKRRATRSKEIKDSLNEFLDNAYLRKILQIYILFGYS
jgi:hypothetical protein